MRWQPYYPSFLILFILALIVNLIAMDFSPFDYEKEKPKRKRKPRLELEDSVDLEDPAIEASQLLINRTPQ